MQNIRVLLMLLLKKNLMKNQERLNSQEWIVVLSLILLMSVITYITHRPRIISPQYHSKPHDLISNKICVHIKGAVENPSVYIVEKGSTIGEVLSEARLLPNADLSHMLLEKKLKDGQLIKVPKKETISIYLEGAVKYPGEMIIPKGTVLEELLTLVELAEDADTSKLRRKKKLKNGEIIKVFRKKNALR